MKGNGIIEPGPHGKMLKPVPFHITPMTPNPELNLSPDYPGPHPKEARIGLRLKKSSNWASFWKRTN